MNFKSFFTTTVACSALSLGAFAQSAQIPAPAQEQAIVIENATIHTVADGVIDGNGWIVFEKGRITQMGRGSAPNISNAQRFNAQGLHVYPGLIASETQLGLTETGSVGETQDYRELGDFTPEVRAAVAINPDSDLIPVTRANGILMGLIFPSGGTVSGRASAVRLDGWTWEDMTIKQDAGLVLNWPRVEPVSFGRGWRSRGGSSDRVEERLNEINQFFDLAEAYLTAKEADPSTPTDLRFESMRNALSGETPVFIRANSPGQIESAVAWAVGRELKPVIVGGSQAHEALAILRKHDVPVILSGTHRLPSRADDAYDAPFTVPKALYDAGVRFAIASGAETPHERDLNHTAATAAAYGLPKDMALRAVTLSAAEILGIDEQYGSLEVGKSATLILTTGDPLEITEDTLVAFIDGRQIDLGSRHKRLYAKYLEKYRQLGLLPRETQNPDANEGIPVTGGSR